MADFISTIRIGQIGGSRSSPSWPNAFDPQHWPLLNDITLWGAAGFDEGANVEHNGRTYIFTGDVNPIQWDGQTPLNSDLVAWTDDETIMHRGGHRPLGYNFHLPHDVAADGDHQPDWMFCAQCARLVFAGYSPVSPSYVSVCPKGGSHAPLGWNFVLPHDLSDAVQKSRAIGVTASGAAVSFIMATPTVRTGWVFVLQAKGDIPGPAITQILGKPGTTAIGPIRRFRPLKDFQEQGRST